MAPLVLMQGFGSPATPLPPPVGNGVLGPLRSFPFAQGYKVGTTLTGGRSLGAGEVRKVTNLNDSGVGSLRAALATPGPADIVFEVGGMIPLLTQIEPVTGPPAQDWNVTIWGETAPSPGITLIQANASVPGMYFMALSCNNVVVRHLRFVYRHDLPGGVNFGHYNLGRTGLNRVITANCSFTRTSAFQDTVDIDDPCRDVTFYRCLWYNTGKGLLLHFGSNASDLQRFALMQNAWILVQTRSFTSKVGCKLVRYNDYSYACGFSEAANTHTADTFQGSGSAGATGGTRWSYRGCRYEPNATYNHPKVTFRDQIGDFSHKSYFDDNDTLVRNVESGAVVQAVATEADLGIVLPEVTTVLPSTGIKGHVLNHAGARPLDRDFVDQSAIDHANNGTGTQGGSQPSYSISSTSAAFTTPVNWNQQAPGEATGWRILDKFIYENYTLAVENV